jgi:hypothetical protein
MKHNKAPGPGSFPAEFYQTFWDIIKGDLLELFAQLPAGQLIHVKCIHELYPLSY